MSTIANNINTYADMTAYNADTNKDYPNVSYIVASDEVKWVGEDPRIIAVYNITDTSAATKLLNSTANISDMIIDGVQQPSVVTSYQFSTTGEHIVKYVHINSDYINFSFNGCTNLINLSLPDRLLQINSTYFCNGCTSLRKVKLPNNLNYINDAAFYDCSLLSSIIIPSGVTFIGGGLNKGAFQNCSSLTSVTCLATTPPSIRTRVFDNTNNCPIYVPAASVEAYKAATNWSNYASRIQAIPTT